MSDMAVHARSPRGPLTASRGVTLLELMMALMIAGVLAAAAVPAYQSHVARLRNQQAITDIGRMHLAVERYRVAQGKVPDSLADIGFSDLLDPWGQAYHYLSFSAGIPGWQGQRRKDRNLVPINSEFDLYSAGPDGQSRPPLTAPASQDDIILANDGAYIGVARDY